MMLGLREDVAPEKDIGLGDARVVKCRLTKTEGYFIPLTLWFIFILSGRPRICGKPPCLCCWGMTPAIPGWTFYAQICSKTIWHNRSEEPWALASWCFIQQWPSWRPNDFRTKKWHQWGCSRSLAQVGETGYDLAATRPAVSSHLQQSFYPGAREGAPMMPSLELRCLSEAEKSEARKCLGSPKDGCLLTGKNADNPKRWTGREAKLKCEFNSILTAQVQMCQKVDHGPVVVVDDDELKKVLF